MFDNVPSTGSANPQTPLSNPAVNPTSTPFTSPAVSPQPVTPTSSLTPPSSPPPANAAAPIKSPSVPVVPAKAPPLTAEKITVMPQKFYVPPKNPTPWGKIILSIVVVVVVGGGIIGAAYYVKEKMKPPEDLGTTTKPPAGQQPAPDGATASSDQGATQLIPPAQPSPLPISSPDQPVTPPPVEPPAVTPPLTGVKLPASDDTDNDNLTDVEEQLYGTTTGEVDTNHNTYQDGREVGNLYSPTDPDKNKRLWQTPVVNPYENSQVGYQILCPAGWVARATDSTGREVLFNAPTGEFIDVVAEDNSSNISPLDWYLKESPGVDATKVQTVKTRSGLLGIKSLDESTIFVALKNKMVILSYNTGVRTTANFWTTFGMMVASLQAVDSSYWPFSQASVPPPANAPSSADVMNTPQ